MRPAFVRRCSILLTFVLSSIFAFSSPVVTLTPTSLSFGTQTENTTSTGQTITLQNTGTSSLTIDSITLGGSYPGQFTKTTTCGSSLAVNASCTVTVKFSPTYLAPETASVVFTTNAASSPNSVPLSGIGVASGMVLYPSSAMKPTRQINVFGGPINASSPDYSHLMGSGTGILNAYTAGTYLTGVTSSLPLGCSSSSCTGAAATYLDHVNATGGLGSGACPSLAFSSGTDPIDTFVNSVASLGYINNFILVNASYGGGPAGNTATPQYVWSQNWADNIDNDCADQDGSLTWTASTYYLPGDYILANSAYWQMQKMTCTNTDTNDIRCESGASEPNFSTCTSPCSDGSGTNQAVWTKLTTGHAPPLDGWCTSDYQGVNCYTLSISGTVTVSGSSVTVTVTNPPTWHTDGTDSVSVQGTGGSGSTNYDCSSCPVTGSTSTTVTYTLSGKVSGSTTTGTIFGDHYLNINTPNATLALLQTTLPVPWEQPNRRRAQYMLSQIDAHYKNSIGYVQLGLTKGGESSQDDVSGWPWYSANQYASYEKIMYAFEASAGCGTDFACVGNLSTNPSVEANYMNSNDIGFDNNGLQTDHAYTIDYYAPSLPPAGKLFHGGDWALEFSTYNAAQSNGKYPVTTLQSTTASTPGTCSTGTCSLGSCTSAGVNGAMSADTACTTSPFTSGYPGDLPIAQDNLTNNNELYFCDAALALDSSYSSTTSCSTHYSQTTYQTLYQDAFSSFLTY
jgi:hypothetical protein